MSEGAYLEERLERVRNQSIETVFGNIVSLGSGSD